MSNISPKAIYWGKVLGKFVSVQLLVQVLGFASGILVIRTLDQQQYAYFTIANTMQATMNLLADSGISGALLAIGGKVWQEQYRFSQLINTALQLRFYLAAITFTVFTPILLWMLFGNGASVIEALSLAAVVMIGLNAQLTTNVLDLVLTLHSQISRIQKLDLLSTVSRLILLIIAYLTFLNAAVAVLTASLSLLLKRLLLRYWVNKTIEPKVPINKEDKREIIEIIKIQLPGTIFYCVQGQLTIWLISIFGNTKNIAEVGALGRLAIVFSVINAVMSNIVLPRFARCQSVKILRQQYWQIIGLFLCLGLIILIFTTIFPDQILWVLGGNYTHLKNELLLVAISTIFNSITATMWSLNCAKAWIKHSWLNIPATIISQILLLLILDVSTVKGVIIFGTLSIIPTFVVNAILTYRGLFSYNSELV